MSGVFERVEMTWRGKSYVIEPNRVLRALARVEEVITLQQLEDPQRVSIAKLAMAYGTLLRFSGAPANDDEVYEMLFSDGEVATAAVQVVSLLVKLMIPKKVREKLEARKGVVAESDEGASVEGKDDAVTTAGS